MDDLSRFCCLNVHCADLGKRAHGNLTVTGHYGPQRRRLLRCRTCKERFSERKGTPFFDSRLSEDKIVTLLDHIAEGCGVRQTGRLIGVNRNTVVRFSLLAGDHAKALHDELVAFSPQYPGSPVRRKVGVRPKKGKALRSK